MSTFTRVYIKSTLTDEGNTALTVRGGMTVDETIYANKDIQASGGISAPSVTITGGGGIVSSGDVDISGALTVSGASQFDNALTVGGNITVTGTSNITGDLNVTGVTTIEGALTSNSTTTVDGNLTVTGASTFNNAVTVDGQVNASSAVVSGTTTANVLTVTNTGTVNGQLNVNGGATIAGDLTVNGSITSINTESLTVEDPLIQLANTNAGDSVNSGFIAQYNDGADKYTGLVRDANDGNYYLITDSTTTAAGNLSGSTRANLNIQDLDATGATFSDYLSVAGDASVTGNLVVTGTSTLSGKVTVNDAIELQVLSADPSTAANYASLYTKTASGDTVELFFQKPDGTSVQITNPGGNIAALSDVTANSIPVWADTGGDSLTATNVVIDPATNNMTIGGTLSVGGDVNVTGASTFVNTATFSSDVVVSGSSTLSGAVTMSSSLDVSGVTTVGGATTLSGSLDVTGSATVDSLNVSGSTTLDGATTVGSTLNVAGDVTVTGSIVYTSGLSSLTITPSSTITGTTDVDGSINLNGVISLKKQDAPTAISGYGTIYALTGTNELRYVNDSGDFEILTENFQFLNSTGAPHTQNSIAVFSNTGGLLIQSTNVTIDNNDNITGANDGTFGGDVTVGGSLIETHEVITSNYSATATDRNIFVNTTSAVTITLPSISSVHNGKRIYVADVLGGATATVNPNTGDLVYGQSNSVELNGQWSHAHLLAYKVGATGTWIVGV